VDRFLAGQMGIFRPRTDLVRVLVALAPLIGAAWIAISRLEDYRHDVFDVTCGSFLGMLMAYFSYRRYYPSLRVAKCDKPYPSRYEFAIHEEQKISKGDEEQGLNQGARLSSDDSMEVAETYPLNDMRVDP
jgi:diacylglycerol diphosphate phosphatase / phosphatidate phosphatase